jgi:hypothetical protein
MSPPTHGDVVVAAAGASGALAGLVLVFLGVLVTTYQQLVGATPDDVLARFRSAAVATLVVFVFSLASVALDVAWLAAAGGSGFFRVTLVAFFVQLAAIGVVGAWTTIRVLLKG